MNKIKELNDFIKGKKPKFDTARNNINELLQKIDKTDFEDSYFGQCELLRLLAIVQFELNDMKDCVKAIREYRRLLNKYETEEEES